jgi:two-component system, HptB-dependent secretion and biofilm response regulator
MGIAHAPALTAAATDAAPIVQRVLVVDDSPLMRAMLTRFLKRMRYQVETAANGVEAIQSVLRAPPDVIIMDVEMPLMDGYGATSRIRALASQRWLPIIFLSAVGEGSALVRALEHGGDDYLIKPISYEVLRAKMHVIARMLGLQRELEERNARLEAYREAEDEQNDIAEKVIRRFALRDLEREQAIQHWINPASFFCGDAVAAARTPGGVLHVLIADGTGHGLAAALSTLPVTQPFYRMTEAGYSLPQMLHEMNEEVCRLLPVERFVAVTLIAIDFEEQLIEIWIGGNPPLCILGERGNVLHFARSRNFALGVVANPRFQKITETYQYDEACQVVTCSDGLFDAVGLPATESGALALAQWLAPYSGATRMDVLKTRCGPAAVKDDLSAVMIDCKRYEESGASVVK